jgi:zinc transporter, ZIP family
VLEAFAWGLLAGSSLIAGGLVALAWKIGDRALGIVMAFGSGVLISAVAYELVQSAFETSAGDGGVALGLVAGSVAFYAGDSLIDRGGGAHRKHSDGRQAEGSPLAIVLGIALDGIPESTVLGLTLASGDGVSAAMFVAVLLSNFPESFAATSGLARAAWPSGRILGLWSAIAIVSGLAAMLGYAIVDASSPTTIAFVLAFAAGAILTMLADTMIPQAYAHGGKLVGVVTTLGFGLAFAISALE